MLETALIRLANAALFLHEAYEMARSHSRHEHIAGKLHRAMVEAARVKEVLVEERWRDTEYSAGQVEGRRRKR